MTEGEGPFLADTGNGLTIRYQGRNLYAPTSPIDSARRRASTLAVGPQTLVFVPSPLLFYGISDLLDDRQEDVHLLCVEADETLMRLSIGNAPPALLTDGRLSFLRTESVDEVLRALHRAGIHRFRRASELLVNAGSSLNRPLYSRMFRAVEHEIHSYWRNRMTLMHMSHLWIKNFFANLATAAAGRDLARLRTKLPVVVAGAGESLEAAAPALRSLRARYFLLAVDTAVGSVDGLGLRPDAVVVLDAQAANLTDLVGFDATGVGLLADISAYPECVRRFSGEKWFFFSEFARLGLFDRARTAGLLPTAVPPLGSVGVAALYCALAISDAPVLFAGLDFAFRPGKSHARGAPAHIDRLRRGDRLSPPDLVASSFDRPHLSVESKGGSRLWSDNTLLGYSGSLDIMVEGRNRVYDIGRTGIPNAATNVVDPDQLRRLLPAFEGEAPLEARLRDVGLPGDGSRTGGPPDKGAEAAAFLTAERQMIDAAVRTVMEALKRRAIGENAGELLRGTVKELDYVYLHFPDWSEEPALTESFLKRFVEAAETRASWIDRALSLLT